MTALHCLCCVLLVANTARYLLVLFIQIILPIFPLSLNITDFGSIVLLGQKF